MNTLLALIVISLLIVILLAITYSIIRFQLSFHKTNKKIHDSVQTKNIELSPTTVSIVDLAVELWRLDKRLTKTKQKLSDDENMAIHNSVDKIRRFVQRNDIEVFDYTGQAYNEGMNLDVISSDKDSKLKQSIIYKTHEPAIFHKGKLIRKTKVIIHEK